MKGKISQEEQNKLSWILFIDFKGAYNSINHQTLWKKLKDMGVGKNTIQLIKFMFENLAFWDGNNLWQQGQGLPQGSISAPFLFNIYINSLMNLLSKNKNNTFTAAYADDVVSAGDGLENIHKTINLYNQWSKNNYMKINLKKSGIMIINKNDKNKQLI